MAAEVPGPNGNEGTSSSSFNAIGLFFLFLFFCADLLLLCFEVFCELEAGTSCDCRAESFGVEDFPGLICAIRGSPSCCTFSSSGPWEQNNGEQSLFVSTGRTGGVVSLA